MGRLPTGPAAPRGSDLGRSPRYTDEDRRRAREGMQALRQRRMAAGQCVVCEAPSPGYRRCSMCAQDNTVERRSSRGTLSVESEPTPPLDPGGENTGFSTPWTPSRDILQEECEQHLFVVSWSIPPMLPTRAEVWARTSREAIQFIKKHEPRARVWRTRRIRPREDDE